MDERLRPALLCIAERIANTMVSIEEAKDPDRPYYCKSTWQLETELKELVKTYRSLKELAEKE